MSLSLRFPWRSVMKPKAPSAKHSAEPGAAHLEYIVKHSEVNKAAAGSSGQQCVLAEGLQQLRECWEGMRGPLQTGRAQQSEMRGEVARVNEPQLGGTAHNITGAALVQLCI